MRGPCPRENRRSCPADIPSWHKYSDVAVDSTRRANCSRMNPARKTGLMKRVQAIFGAIMFASGVMPASAQSLSSKPIRIVVPVAAGAATDLLGRMVGDWLGKQTGLPIVVENRTGAGGNVALEQVAKAEPDGHTLLIATNGAITINRAMLKKDPVEDRKSVV